MRRRLTLLIPSVNVLVISNIAFAFRFHISSSIYSSLRFYTPKSISGTQWHGKMPTPKELGKDGIRSWKASTISASSSEESPEMKDFDFDKVVDRRGTQSLKWERHKDQDVIPLWLADTDFQACPAIIDALEDRIAHGIFGYTIPDKAIKNVVLDYLRERHKWEAKQEWIYFLPGVVQGLNLACRIFEEPIEVLVPSPVYGPVLAAPLYSGHRCVNVPLVRGPIEGTDGSRIDWTFDWKALDRLVSPKTRLFMLCNPHNPVGRVFTRPELEKLGEFCLKHDLIVCSDEIHADLIFNPTATPHVPVALISEDLSNRSIILQSPSKTFNTPSMGLAYAVIPNKQLRLKFMKAGRGLVCQMPAFGYTSLQAAYQNGEPWRQALVSYLDGNRQLLYDYLETHLPEIKIWPMEATYLAWLDVSALGLRNPWQFFVQAGVGLASGDDFGADGKQFLRLSFGCQREALLKALQRMHDAVRKASDCAGIS